MLTIRQSSSSYMQMGTAVSSTRTTVARQNLSPPGFDPGISTPASLLAEPNPGVPQSSSKTEWVSLGSRQSLRTQTIDLYA